MGPAAATGYDGANWLGRLNVRTLFSERIIPIPISTNPNTATPMNRTGKIARLPHPNRQEFNRRLFDNEPGGTGKAKGRVKDEELGTSGSSDPVAPGQSEIRRGAQGAGREAGKSKRQYARRGATTRRHIETGKEECRMKNEELAEMPGNSDQSGAVQPSRTTFPPNFKASGPADVATSCPHPYPQAKPLLGMTNFWLGMAFAHPFLRFCLTLSRPAGQCR